MSGRHVRHYEPVVSVRTWFRLRTTTKTFCNCAVAPDDDEPNTHACAVCLGLPGALPVLNERVVEHAVRVALALGATVPPVSMFDRRHEFSPVVPRGYRITQHERPLATRGQVQIGETAEGAPLVIAVPVVRIEEEGGRAVHGRFPRASGLDYNLAGAPLVVVGSAPEMHSSAEAVAFVRALRRLVRGVGASEARFTDASLRLRIRISVRRLGDTGLHTPCELVGIDSLASLRTAIDQEFARQTEVLAAGHKVEAAAQLWDPATSTLVPSRVQRGDVDPRYLPDPDLPPLVLTAGWIDEQRQRVPSYPSARREHLAQQFALRGTALDRLTADPELADYYESVARRHGEPGVAAEWVLGPVLSVVDRTGDLDAFSLRVRPADLAELLDMLRDGKLGPAGARYVFDEMVRTGNSAARVADRDPANATRH